MSAAKRRPRGDGSIYRNGTTGRWEGLIDLGRNAAGKRVRRKVSGESRAEVADKLRKLKAEVDAGTASNDRATTVAQLLEKWAADVLPAKVDESTVAAYRWAIDRHLIPGLGTRAVAKLTVDDVEVFLKAKAKAGLARNSCFRLRAVLGQAIRWAERRGMVARNVASLAELPAEATPPREGRALTSEEARALLEAAKTITVKIPRTDRTETRPRRTAALWTLQLALGLRPGEVCGLTWPDVDLDAEVIHVRRSMKYRNGKPIGLGEVKTGNRGRGRRTLQLPTVALEALRAHRAAQVAERLAMARYWPDEWADLVFVTEAGTPYESSNLRRDLNSITKAAGIGHVTRYDLRHSAATLMAEAGMRLEDIADQLGHEDVTMARGVYTHATGRTLTAGAAVMGDTLTG